VGAEGSTVRQQQGSESRTLEPWASRYSQAALNRIARELNERPRKTLGFETPTAKLAALVASTP
jgi:hypothetical protein